jgi:hypothetical protein
MTTILYSRLHCNHCTLLRWVDRKGNCCKCGTFLTSVPAEHLHPQLREVTA